MTRITDSSGWKRSGILRAAMAGTVAAVAVGTVPVVAHAQQLRIAQGLQETYTAYKPLVNFAAALSKADIDAKVYTLALLKLQEVPAGVRDGIADAGYTVFPYLAAEFSELNLVYNMAMLATSGEKAEVPGAAMVGAAMEYVMFNCEGCQDQLRNMNHVYIAGASSSPYYFICAKEFNGAADLRGKKVRVGADNFGRWVEHLGGMPVKLQGNDTYEALNTGNIDCTIAAAAELVGQQYIEVANALTLGVSVGSFSGIGASDFNREVWQDLTEAQRRLILDEGARLAAQIVLAYVKEDADAIAEMKKANKVVKDASADLHELTDAFVEKDIETIKQTFRDNYGLDHVDEKVAKIQALIEKWKKLTNEAGADEDALTELYRTELTSKLDAATYGMD